MNKIILGFCILLLTSLAQEVTAEMVGALMPAKNIPYFMTIHSTMTKELSALNSDAEIILQRPSPTVRAWSNATRKLGILGAEVIVAYGSATAICIGGENPNIPIVYSGAYDPSGCGVKSKVTGMDATIPFDVLIDNLKKISNFSKLAILYSNSEIGSVKQMQAVEAIAKMVGAEVVRVDVKGSDSFELPAVDALLLTSAAIINQKKNLQAIIANAQSQKIATASVLSGTCELGVLISISANPVHQGRGTAEIVAKILQGIDPKEIPPNKKPEVEMTINLSAAKDLGFSVPFELLGTAKIVK